MVMARSRVLDPRDPSSTVIRLVVPVTYAESQCKSGFGTTTTDFFIFLTHVGKKYLKLFVNRVPYKLLGRQQKHPTHASA